MKQKLIRQIALLAVICLLGTLPLTALAAEGEALASDPAWEPVPTSPPAEMQPEPADPVDPVTPEPVPPDPITQEPTLPDPVDPVAPEPTLPDPVTPEPLPPDPVTPEPLPPDPVTPELTPSPPSDPPAAPAPAPIPEPTEPEKPPAPEPIRLDPFDPGPTPPPPVEGDIERFEDGLHYEIPEDWTAQDVVSWFIHHYDLDADCFAVSFYCPATGERADWNEDAYFLAASTYKLPLNMYYYEQEAAGVYSPSTVVGEMPLSQAHMQSLLWSMNDVSEAMIYHLGPFYIYKHLVTERYGTLPEEAYPLAYWGNNYYSTRFMVDTLTCLYEHPEDYREALDYLTQAMPGSFLKKYSGELRVAHKYGSMDLNVHDVGILFTEEPCLVAIYTHDYQRGVFGAELISRLGKAFLDYQTQRTELDRLAAKQTEAPEPETAAPEAETQEASASGSETRAPEAEPASERPASPETEAAAGSAAPSEPGGAAVPRPGSPETSPGPGPAEADGRAGTSAASFPILPLVLILLGLAAIAFGLIFFLRGYRNH